MTELKEYIWTCPKCKTRNRHRLVHMKGIIQYLRCKKCKYKKPIKTNGIVTLKDFMEVD